MGTQEFKQRRSYDTIFFLFLEYELVKFCSSVLNGGIGIHFNTNRNDEMKRRELTFICLWALMAVVSGGCKNPCVSESYRAYQQCHCYPSTSRLCAVSA